MTDKKIIIERCPPISRVDFESHEDFNGTLFTFKDLMDLHEIDFQFCLDFEVLNGDSPFNVIEFLMSGKEGKNEFDNIEDAIYIAKLYIGCITSRQVHSYFIANCKKRLEQLLGIMEG